MPLFYGVSEIFLRPREKPLEFSPANLYLAYFSPPEARGCLGVTLSTLVIVLLLSSIGFEVVWRFLCQERVGRGQIITLRNRQRLSQSKHRCSAHLVEVPKSDFVLQEILVGVHAVHFDTKNQVSASPRRGTQKVAIVTPKCARSG